MKRKRKKQSTQKSYTCKIFGLIVAITVIAVSGGILLKRTITESPENTLMEYMNHIEKKEYEVMYTMIDSDEKVYLTKEEYIQRNSKIYEGIEVSDIKISHVTVKEKKADTVTPVSYTHLNEQGTHKYVSELLGKATIDTNTYGKSTGHSGNYSTNYQNTGRELMTPDEVRMLDNRYAILFIRGERPILDEKFDILKHPNVGLTTDGNGKPYLHGAVDRAVASISLGDSLEGELTDDSLESEDYELLSDEDLEEIIQKYV